MSKGHNGYGQTPSGTLLKCSASTVFKRLERLIRHDRHDRHHRRNRHKSPVGFAEMEGKFLDGLVALAMHFISTGRLGGFTNMTKVSKKGGNGYRNEYSL